jgi:hypothetical protein
MQPPPWQYLAPSPSGVGTPSLSYRRAELMGGHGEAQASLRRANGSNRLTLQLSQFSANGHVQFATYLTPQQAVALRNALNDALAEIGQEARA